MSAQVELYRDQAGQWRWRAVAANGRIVADGGQGYTSPWGARDGIAVAAKILADPGTLEVLRGDNTEEADQ